VGTALAKGAASLARGDAQSFDGMSVDDADVADDFT
jgi:hypothetical protein